MEKHLPSTGETQAISAQPEHHGFVDNCIALIQSLIDQRSLDLPEVQPQPEDTATKELVAPKLAADLYSTHVLDRPDRRTQPRLRQKKL